MNEGFSSVIPVPNPEERLTELKERLDRIFAFTVEFEDLANIDSYIDSLITETTDVVEGLRAFYAANHPEVTDVQEQEDRALSLVGYDNVPNVLDLLADIKDLLGTKIPHVLAEQIPEVITPPDTAKEASPRDSNEDADRNLIPRLKMLLYIVMHDCGVAAAELNLRRGSVNKSMVRKEPYYSLTVESLNRQVIVCDEEGNRTDIFDTSTDEYKRLGKETIDGYTKFEKTAYGNAFPGSHVSLHFSKKWPSRIYTHLTSPLPLQTGEDTTVLERPRILDTITRRTDMTDFYVDEHGEKWGSRVALAESISARKLSMNPNFIELLETLPYQIIRAGNNTVKSYGRTAVISAMKEHPVLSAYFRKADETKFYTDESGEKWGSTRTLCENITSGAAANNPLLVKLFKLLPTQKILVGSNFADGYKYSDVRRAILEVEELAFYLRKADESRFYTDEQGERWGSRKALADALSSNPDALNKSLFYQRLLQKLTSQKILVAPAKPDAYKLSEVLEAMKNDRHLSRYLKPEMAS